MTCVAYDGKSIAADRRRTWDREPTPHGTDKIRLLRQGQRRFAVAHAGVEGQAYRMLTHHLFGHRNAGVLEPYAKLGEFWKSLGDDHAWGGDFKSLDANHFSITYQGRR